MSTNYGAVKNNSVTYVNPMKLRSRKTSEGIGCDVTTEENLKYGNAVDGPHLVCKLA